MQDDIKSLSHSKWRCKYHIVFARVVNTFPDKKLSSGHAAIWARRIRASIGER